MYDQSLFLDDIKNKIKSDPSNPELHLALAMSYKEMGMLEEAEREFNETIKIKPDMGTAHYGLGNVYHEMSEEDAAIAEYEKAAKNDPGLYEARFTLGVHYREAGRLDEAIRELRSVTEMVPDLGVAHYVLAKTYLAKGNNREAEEEFKKTMHFELDNMDPRFMLRYLPTFMRTIDEELIAAQKAVDADPCNAEAHNRLGVIMLMMDNFNCGTEEFKKAVALQLKNAEYHLNLGYAYSLYDEGEAVIEVYKALSLKPDWLDAWLMLGALYEDLDRMSDAVEVYKKALKFDPDNDVVHYLLGNVLIEAEEMPEARKEMLTAIKLNKNNYDARRALVELYLRYDLYDEAIEMLEEIVKNEPGARSARQKLEMLKAKRKGK